METPTPTEITKALAAKMSGRFNELPTPMRKGTRVAIHMWDIGSEETVIAYGTLRGSYGTGADATSLVVLDTTETVVDVPWSMLRRP